MDFEYSEEQKMLKKNCRDFMEKEIVPIIDDYEKRGATIPREEAKSFIKKLIPLGYIAGLIDEEHGGLGLDLASYGLIMEELNYAWASLANIVSIAGLTALFLSEAAGEDLIKDYLGPSLSGNIIGCLALSEPDVGSAAPRGIKTRAVLEGDEYVINGLKTWVSNGSISDILNVICLLDDGKGTPKIATILVDRKEYPYTATDYHKLGWRAASTAEVSFDNCRVPKRNLLKGGDDSLGWVLEVNRAFVGIRACGVAQAAIDASIKYAQERVQFGKPIGRFQLIQEMIADMVIKNDSARFLGLHALELLDKGIRCPKECSMAKAYCSEIVNEVASKAIQIHGAMGLMDDLPLERYFRDARMFSIPDGTTEIQKLIVGREILGMHAFV